jgi:hypothetical protein
MYLDLPIFNFLVLKFFSSNYRLKQIKENKKKQTNKLLVLIILVQVIFFLSKFLAN